jgi:predicted phage terminase large subunit-like protein
LAHAPAAKILLISYGQELADQIAYDIRATLQSDWFRRSFKTRIAKSKLSDLVTTAGGGLRSVAVEGSVTGFGADLIIVDDPVQIKDSENIRLLERVNDLFDSAIRTRLNNQKKGAIVIVAHRLAEDDLPGHVREEGGWTTIRLPLIARHSRTYKTDDGVVWLREKGDILRPDAFNARDIKRLRQTKHPDFETLQQQNPGARDRLRILAEHIGVFASAEGLPNRPVVLSIDPAQKGGLSNSFGVMQAWTAHEDRYLLLDQVRQQARFTDFRAEVHRFIRRFRPSAILIEATGQGPSLMSDIKPQRGMDIVPITPADDKITRLRRHQKKIRDGLIFLPEDAPWRGEFVGELTQFPYAAFDDQVDALTQFLDWIEKNPSLAERSPRHIIAGVTAHGALTTTGLRPTLEIPGAVFVRRRF